MAATETLTARFAWNDGMWVVWVDQIPECITFGINIPHATRRLRDALSLFRGDADHIPVEVRPAPGAVAELVQELSRARTELHEASERAHRATSRAAISLSARGISRRDAAALLGISHQRVQQLIDGS